MQRPLVTVDLARQLAAQFLGVQHVVVEEQSGGLSGARVWRVESSRGAFALRQYPTEFPTEERLRWLHQFLKDVQGHGCKLLPCPLALPNGATWLKHEAHFWELQTWIPGEPRLAKNPSRELLIAAAFALAEVHRVASQMPFEPFPGVKSPTALVGLVERRNLLNRWFTNDKAELAERAAQQNLPSKIAALYYMQCEALQQQGQQLLAQLEQSINTPTPAFPVLRDVQPEHVLFSNDKVSGFIDVTAARIETPMADLARMLQRWRFTEQEWYAAAIEAYQRTRTMTSRERVVLEAYDLSARLLSGVQWLRWIVLEEREFANHDLVERHWDRIAADLARFLKTSTIIPVS